MRMRPVAMKPSGGGYLNYRKWQGAPLGNTVTGPDPAPVPVGGPPVAYTLNNHMGIDVAFDSSAGLCAR
jgi:hypothetical protein